MACGIKSGNFLGTVGALAVAAVLLVQPAEASKCASPKEHDALNARVLQTELMVAALSCQNQPLYNAFVKKFRKQLVANGNSMRTYFENKHGSAADSRMNAMVTRLANEASQVSNAQHLGFCYQTSLLFSEALKTDPAEFKTLLDKPTLRGRHGVTPCVGSGVIDAGKPVVGFGVASDRAFK